MKHLIKFFLLVHRYLGLALSLLFVIWFLSGFAMMYVKYPTMRQNERLQNLHVAQFQNAKFNLKQAMEQAGVIDTVRIARLGMMLDRPVYRFTTTKGEYKAIFADTGELFAGTDSTLAIALATAFETQKSKPTKIEKLTEIDQWMAAARSMGYSVPVYRLTMDDAEGTYLYVSIQTGEVVQRVNARQRFLAWLGPIPHWIYPTILLRNRPIWNDIIIWTSTLGSVMCMAGIVIGFVRYKRRDSKSLVFSPYKKRWFRWHHYTGFVFGIFVFTWVFSGLLSMTPWDWAPFTRLNPEESDKWTGGIMKPELFTGSIPDAAVKLSTELKIKEVHYTQIFGKPYWLAYQDEFNTRLLAADDSLAKPMTGFQQDLLLAGIKNLNTKNEVVETILLTEYDDYYYSKNNEKRLPVLRVKLDTPDETWYYADLKTGQIVLKHERLSRLERWLYHGLHSFDFSFLLYRRPLWDVTVIFFMMGGLLVSATGVVLSWKWLKKWQQRNGFLKG
jgi:hypothetical protein